MNTTNNNENNYKISDILEGYVKLNDMWVHSPPLGAQANFNRMEKRDTM